LRQERVGVAPNFIEASFGGLCTLDARHVLVKGTAHLIVWTLDASIRGIFFSFAIAGIVVDSNLSTLSAGSLWAGFHRVTIKCVYNIKDLLSKAAALALKMAIELKVQRRIVVKTALSSFR
jgi:hypothetical protein